jgi:hypothetical protein
MAYTLLKAYEENARTNNGHGGQQLFVGRDQQGMHLK